VKARPEIWEIIGTKGRLGARV